MKRFDLKVPSLFYRWMLCCKITGAHAWVSQSSRTLGWKWVWNKWGSRWEFLGRGRRFLYALDSRSCLLYKYSSPFVTDLACYRSRMFGHHSAWGVTCSTRNTIQLVFIVMGHKRSFLILTELKGKGLECSKWNLFIFTPFFHIYAIQYLSLASCSHFNMCHVPTLG